ncbi:hypothetical protein EXIGLDRAFT_606965 [Exidia glandulosa HHB12029]|uniref:Reverse transcriptase domain-containing protein n=1 Tax=Exidia glandulosa HHB12029 TaxID=1314781 RepID=A0A165LYE2_EXIGL|nr:hypothetical protein EXIGLDRAFT_606965 [Exidia glandulosa HHB12029]
MSDFGSTAHPDDVVLASSIISHLEHADDVALMSTTAAGLQSHLNTLAEWAAHNQMEVNTKKTVVMIFYPPRRKVPQELPQYTIYGQVLDIVQEYRYVGTLLSSKGSNPWDSLIAASTLSARRAANVCFFVESRTGQLPPWEGKLLYQAQIDSRLTYAVEVTGVGTKKQIESLEAVQLTFLRRLLGLQTRSQRCIVFTETGLWPIRFRRLSLTLGYLQYLLGLPVSHYARAALHQTMENATMRCSGWWYDLRSQVESVGLSLPVDVTAEGVSDLISRIRTHMYREIGAEVDTSPKLELLRTRVEYDKKGQPSTPVLAFRQYLKVKNKAARYSLTRLLLSDHRLAVETGRWQGVEREKRKCRLCNNAVEEPLHALFRCTASDALLQIRARFWDECQTTCGEAMTSLRLISSMRESVDARSARLRLELMSPSDRIFVILADSRLSSVFATFAHRVLTFFDDLPPRRYQQDDRQQDQDDG